MRRVSIRGKSLNAAKIKLKCRPKHPPPKTQKKRKNTINAVFHESTAKWHTERATLEYFQVVTMAALEPTL